jgi:hypothetical protein
LGLGKLAPVIMLLTLLFEGASLEVPPNQFARNKMKKSLFINNLGIHRRSTTNENVIHVKSIINETQKLAK